MRLTKYDGLKSATAGNVIVSGGSSDTDTPSRSEGDTDRTIWGQHDDGEEDIDGTATINGDVHIKSITPPTYDPDDEGDDGEDEEYEEGGGNLDVEGNAEVGGDITAGGHIYINYPEPHGTGTKTCVGSLIKTNADAIKANKDGIQANKDAIAALATRVSTNETDISTNETNIQANADAIAELQSSSLTEQDVIDLIKANLPTVSDMGSYSQPVVLFAGRARRVTYYSDRYYIEGCRLPYFSLTNVIEKGLMTITVTPTEGYRVNVYAVHVTQEKSGDTTDAVTNTEIGNRNEGAHWFETRVDSLSNTTRVYIREFHQRDGNNDSWGSMDWFNDNGVKAINLTLVGYVTALS